MRSVSCQAPEYGEALHQIPNGRWDEDQAVVWNLSLKEVLAGPFPDKTGHLGESLLPPVTAGTGFLRKVLLQNKVAHDLRSLSGSVRQVLDDTWGESYGTKVPGTSLVWKCWVKDWKQNSRG